jgi:hypothetical protein
MGGAKADRLLEIGAHPHAEEAEPGAPGDLAQQGEMQRRLLVERRDTHQALDRQAEPVDVHSKEELYPGLIEGEGAVSLVRNAVDAWTAGFFFPRGSGRERSVATTAMYGTRSPGARSPAGSANR